METFLTGPLVKSYLPVITSPLDWPMACATAALSCGSPAAFIAAVAISNTA